MDKLLKSKIPTVLLTFMVILLIYGSTLAKEKRHNVLYYYNLIPDIKFHEGLIINPKDRYKLYKVGTQWKTEGEFEPINATVDIKNGFIEINDEGGAYLIVLQVVLFRNAVREPMIGVNITFKEGLWYGGYSKLSFFRFNPKVEDVTDLVLPQLSISDFQANNAKEELFTNLKKVNLPELSNLLTTNSFPYIATLPRYGTMVKIQFVLDKSRLSKLLKYYSRKLDGNENEYINNFQSSLIQPASISLQWNKKESRFIK